MTSLNTGSASNYKFNTPLAPKIQPVAIPLTLDFSATLSWEVDLQNQQSRGIIDIIQSIYFDTIDMTTAVDLICSVTNQRVRFPKGSCGYMPLLVPNPPKFVFNSQGGAETMVAYMLNVPLPAVILTP